MCYAIKHFCTEATYPDVVYVQKPGRKFAAGWGVCVGLGVYAYRVLIRKVRIRLNRGLLRTLLGSG